MSELQAVTQTVPGTVETPTYKPVPGTIDPLESGLKISSIPETIIIRQSDLRPTDIRPTSPMPVRETVAPPTPPQVKYAPAPVPETVLPSTVPQQVKYAPAPVPETVAPPTIPQQVK